MDGVLLVARLLLAGVFAAAGAAKLIDLAGTRHSIAGFGVPRVLAGPLAVALPMVEIAIAVALLPQRTTWHGAVAAMLLLLAFLVAIVVNLARGRKPDCRCFGQLRAAPIGPSTVALNLGVLAIAASCVWYREGEARMTDQGLEALAAAALVVAVGLAVVVWQMLREQHRLLERVAALETRLANSEGAAAAEAPAAQSVGGKAPAFALPALAGGTVTLEELLAAGKPVLLVFTEPDCAACKTMLPDLARWQRDQTITVAVVSAGTPDENQALASHGLRHVLLQWKYEVADAYECEGSPGAVIVRPDGTIGSAVAGGKDEIARLAASLLPAPPQSQRIGSTIFMARNDQRP